MRSLRNSSLDCQVLVAHSSLEALEYLHCTGSFAGRDTGNPDVILTDLRIGPMNGADLVTAIREEPKTRMIPIVVLSGAASEKQIEDVYQRGANSFVEKPLDSEEFIRSIQVMARYWGQLNSTPARRASLHSRPYTL